MMRKGETTTITLSPDTARWFSVLVVICLAALDALLIFSSPEDSNNKPYFTIAIVTFFLVASIFAVVSTFMSRKLVEEMKAQGPTAAPAVIAAKTAVLLPHSPLAVQVMTSSNLPAPTDAVAELIARSQRIFSESVRMHRKSTWFLVLANFAIAAVNLGGGDVTLLWSTFFALLLLVPTTLLAFRANADKPQNSLLYLGWLLLHVLWVALTLLVAGFCFIEIVETVSDGQFPRAILVPAVLVVAVLVVHVLRTLRAIDRLRSEILSRSPAKLLFLWVFGSDNRINSLFLSLGALWRSLGPLQLLRGGLMILVGADVFRYLRGGGRQIIALTPEQVDAKISQFPQSPHRWWCVYATNTLLCGDQSWRHALATLLGTSDLVLMDLCAFSPSNAGCIYEIRQLIDKIDVRRFLLLIDKTTDLDFLRSELKSGWDEMAPDSPNRRPDCGPVHLFHLEEEYVDDTVSLDPSQNNARCVMQLLCAGLT
jgi:hypothetical protein